MERDFIKKLSDEITKISTHTLTWSVTIVHKLKITVENNFNSHAHVERDRDVDMFQKCICYFNSHAHVERDSSPIVNAYGVVYFNSHAHVERDIIYKCLHFRKTISTHTLTWSVTWSECLRLSNLQISTHTLTWSVTIPFLNLPLHICISTHTLTWSVTLDVVYIWCLLNVMRTYFFI